MPSQPKINEPLILSMLRTTSPITPDDMRRLCGIVLMGCYDRKVERPFMAQVIDLCTRIHMDLSQMEKGGALRYCLSLMDEKRTPALIDTELDRVVKDFMGRRRALAEKFALVTMCPTPGTPIH